MIIWIVLAAAVSAAVVSLIATPLSMSLSSRLQLFDQPDARKVHVTATPRLGGIGIIAGVLLAGIPAFVILAGMTAEHDGSIVKLHTALLFGALAVFIIGLLDDVFSVPSRFKLLALIAGSLCVCGAGGALTELRGTDLTIVEFHWVTSWLITIVWITGFAVAFNFIDGLDGLSSGLALLASLVLAAFLLQGGHPAAAIPAVVLAGSLVGFLYFNWHPARTFMGDGGSLTIGYLLGALMIMNNPSVGTIRSMFIPSLALSVALVDTALTLFRRRYQQRRSLFSAERGHIHHRLLDRGFTHLQAVKLIHGVSIAAVVIGLVSSSFDSWATLGGISLAVPLLWIFFHFAGSMHTGDMVSALKKKREIDRTSRRFRSSFETLQLEFDEANNFSQWWSTVCSAAERLNFSQLKLPIESVADGRQRTLSWSHPDESIANNRERIDAKIPLPSPELGGGYTSAELQIPSTDSLESAGERLSLFSRLMSENGKQALLRVHRTSNPTGTPEEEAEGEFGSLRVALVHDFFYTYAGAERVVEQIIKLFPHCSVYGLIDFLPEEDRGFLKGKSVKTTFIQKLPFANTKHRAYLPLMPLAIEQLDLSDYDLVISSSYVVAKGVITGPDQLHISYCHSPVRYGWDLQHQYLKDANLGFGPRGMLARALLHYIRNWDARSSLGVDRFIANSEFVAGRIQKFYRRDAEVIPPPVDTEAFVPDPPGSEQGDKPFYLAASRLVTYKRMDLIIEAFNQTPERRLVVIGEGPELERLQRHAQPNVQLLGHQDQESLVRYMQKAKAFIFAAEEDFGIVPVEGQLAGRPVVATNAGGAAEIVRDGENGLLTTPGETAELAEAIGGLLKMPEEAAQLAQRGLADARQRFGLEACVARVNELIAGVVSK